MTLFSFSCCRLHTLVFFPRRTQTLAFTQQRSSGTFSCHKMGLACHVLSAQIWPRASFGWWVGHFPAARPPEGFLGVLPTPGESVEGKGGLLAGRLTPLLRPHVLPDLVSNSKKLEPSSLSPALVYCGCYNKFYNPGLLHTCYTLTVLGPRNQKSRC